MLSKRVMLGVALMMCASAAMAKGDVKAGSQKAAMCVACHGATGKSNSPLYPTIAGQSEDYLSQALHAYKSGHRNGGTAEIMKAYVSGLSDSDINNLAAWYASQKP